MSDPKLPDAVKNAGDRADALVAKATGQPSGEATPASQPAAAPGPENNKPTEPAPDSWEHKYKVAQGMLEKQGTRLSELERANPVLIQQIQDLRQDLLRLQQEPPKPKEEEKPKVPLTQIDGIKQILTEDDIDALDDNGVPEAALPLIAKLVEAIAQSTAGSQIADVTNRMNTIQTTQAKTLDQQFEDGLTSLVPDWSALNADKSCIAWLKGTVSPGTDDTYFALLNLHNKKYNYRKVAEIFNLYKDFAKAQGDQPAPSPLEGEVEPGGRTAAPSGNPPSPESERIWKSSEIAAVYNKIAIGKIKGDEAVALQAEIDLANRKGNIDPNN